MGNILFKKTSLKSYANKKFNQLEEYALQSNIIRKFGEMIYRSRFYNYITQKFDKFRDEKLIEQIKQEPVPKHVAIIMDGNRRFAKELGLSPNIGHLFGRDKIEEVLGWCFDLDIKNLTVYAFSTENFQREMLEVQTLMNLCKDELIKASKDSRIHKNQVRIRVLGRLESLPDDISESAKFVMDQTKDYDKYSFNIALAYGGREEIIQAIQKIAQDVKEEKMGIEDIKESIVSKYLYTNGIPDPDIILRTSGEERKPM